jgi:hypothetical protein
MRADEALDIRPQEPRNAKETERGVGSDEHYGNGRDNEPSSATAREHDLDLTSLTLLYSMITVPAVAIEERAGQFAATARIL